MVTSKLSKCKLEIKRHHREGGHNYLMAYIISDGKNEAQENIMKAAGIAGHRKDFGWRNKH